MSVLHGILELIAPTRCAGCEIPGDLLCSACDERLPRIEMQRACLRCGAPFGALVCTECWATEFAFEAALSVGELDGALARAIVLHKDAGERRLGALLGTMVGAMVEEQWPGWADVVTWVPPSQAALTRRGFDHGRALAEPAALACGAVARPLLARAHARDQRLLGRSERLARAGGSFEPVAPTAGHIVIIDDVMTTGATTDAAAAALLAAGATGVRVAVVARAW